MNNAIITLPEKLEGILNKERDFYYKIMNTVVPFSKILAADDLFFFREYTDHGINHINNTLKYVENLIAEDTFQYLSAKEVGVIVLSVVLHDIGMHTNAEMFKNMIDGKYDELSNLFPNGKTWNKLWQEFLYDSQYWDEAKKRDVFGDSKHKIHSPDLTNFQNLTDYDKKLIGEFIRIYHCRIAHEIAINGYIGKDTIPFVQDDIDIEYFKLAGIVARSHGMNVRDTFEYLETNFGDSRTPSNIHVVYLMVLLRIADYLQIDSSRTNEEYLKINTLYSPYSQQEHKTHLSIKDVQFTNTDKEKIVIQAFPKDAKTYAKIEWLAKDIQREFDLSWAILGEVYSDNKYKLRYRRISSNITNDKYKANLTFVPQEFGLKYNNDLFKLLIAPLYGDKASYGVRELAQNAVDACRSCMDELKNDKPHVKVEVDTKQSLFTITDRGKGMNLYEIKNYFLTIGSSYNDNIDWKKTRDQNKIYRTGRFGIGILAAFLLGPEITVVTKKRGEESGYKFTLSLNDKFIQIDKVKNTEFGTRIEIKCNEKCMEELKRTWGDLWYNWYIGKKPIVEYYIDGEPRKHNRDLSGYKKLEHSSKLYGDVYWKPLRIGESGGSLYCNGFYITGYTDKNHFALDGLENFNFLRIPNLQIIDKYNQLPLNLKRDDIDGNVKYDFEPELAKEVFIDLMCQLMATDKDNINLRYCHLYAEGFSLNSKFTNRNNNTKIRILQNEYKSRDMEFDIDPSKLPIDANYSLSFGTGMFERERLEHRLHEIEYGPIARLFDFDLDDKLLSSELRDYTREIQNYKGWRFNPRNFDNVQLLEKIIDQYGRSALMIRFERTNSESIPNKTIDDLFKKYMNNDPIVPYDMDKRREKFPLLFKDYSKEIDYYLKRQKEIYD